METPISKLLRSVADNIKAIADDMVGSRHMALINEHGVLVVAINAIERDTPATQATRAPGRPQPKRKHWRS